MVPELKEIIENIDTLDNFEIKNNTLYFLQPVYNSNPNNDQPPQNKHRNPYPTYPRLAVPNSSRHTLLQLAHDDQVYGGHLGIRKTQKKLEHYWWPLMSKDIKDYVQTCTICQKFKEPKGPSPGKLHSIPVSKFFEQVHIDIVGPVNANAASGARYIITAIDAYSRYGFARAKERVTTDEIIEFLQDIIAQHGSPIRIVSDQGAQFTSGKYLKFCSDFGIKHQFTTPYHPRANGMDERFNGTLVKILRNYVNKHQYRWDEHLRWALYVYNTTFQESLKYSPHEVMFGSNAGITGKETNKEGHSVS